MTSDALGKVVTQFTDALKETKAFIKTSIEEIVDSPTSVMDTTQRPEDQPASKSDSKGQDVIAAVDEYVKRESNNRITALCQQKSIHT